MSLCNVYICCSHTVFNRSLLAVRWGCEVRYGLKGRVWAVVVLPETWSGLWEQCLRVDVGVGSAERWGFEPNANQPLEFLTIPRCLSEEVDCQRGGSSPRPRVLRRLDSYIPKIEQESHLFYHAVAQELGEEKGGVHSETQIRVSQPHVPWTVSICLTSEVGLWVWQHSMWIGVWFHLAGKRAVPRWVEVPKEACWRNYHRYDSKQENE